MSAMSDKRVLIIAYHFPPSSGSSGIQRTLKFSTYLRDFGWEPIVLTISPRAYEQVNNGQVGEIPEGMVVKRAFGLDTARHLAIKGRYVRWMAQPDRWVSWWPAAVWTGMKLIRKYRPRAIMSTYPIASAHMIGNTLQRLSGLPWIADFRDAMTEPDYPRDPATWALHRRLEGEFVRRATMSIFTTGGTLDMYAQRYPEMPKERWGVIENGFDEENFRDAENGLKKGPLGRPGQLILLHSGILYPQERDPRPLFTAISKLRGLGQLVPDNFKLVLRATGSDEQYRSMVTTYGIGDLVSIEPSIAYRAALQEMMLADGLLLMQASICNHQIPAKLYEYARAGRPILGLTDHAGNTAQLLRELGCANIANIADADEIETVLAGFVDCGSQGRLKGVAPQLAVGCSRHSRTRELAGVLDGIV